MALRENEPVVVRILRLREVVAQVLREQHRHQVGEALTSGEAERAVFVCGSGVGASVAACKLPGIRAAVCHDVYSAHQGVEHDDMNVLCLGSDIVGPQLATDLVRTFLLARFNGGERYVRRLEKIATMERGLTNA